MEKNVDCLSEDRKWLISQSYITENENKKLLIRSVKYNDFPVSLTKTTDYIEMNYSNLFRYLLFTWMYKYIENVGENKKIIELNNLFVTKTYMKYQNITKPFTMISTNGLMVKDQVSKILGISNFSIETTDESILRKVIEKRTEIFTVENILERYYKIRKVIEKTDAGEMKMIEILSNNPDFSYVHKKSGFYGAQQDKNDKDLWATYDKKQISIQVKEPLSGSIKMWWDKNDYYINKNGKKINKTKEFNIVLSDTQIDLHEYNLSNKPPWRFLLLIDNKRGNVYQIDANSIVKIYKNKKNNYTYINIKTSEIDLKKNVKSYKLL